MSTSCFPSKSHSDIPSSYPCFTSAYPPSHSIIEMKSFFAITTVFVALVATAIATPVPVADGGASLPLCPTSFPKWGGIGPVCQPRTTDTAPPAPTQA